MSKSCDDKAVLFVADASQDAQLSDSPWVNGELASVRFYAAAPLIGREGVPLGLVCIWNETAHVPSADEIAHLASVRDTIMAALEARRDEGERAIGRPEFKGPRPSHRDASADPWTIDAVIDNCAVRSVFQPIVHLSTGAVAGFEALSRGPKGSHLESPMAMIDAARSAGRLGELDWSCRVQALQTASGHMHPSLSLFVNAEPAGLAIGCPDHLAIPHQLALRGLRVVLEVVERDLDATVVDLLRATDDVRKSGWGVAIDDVGADVSSLALLPLLRPDVVKLDMTLVQALPANGVAAITAAVNAYTERTGAVIVAEGIETKEHERLAQVFGATYGQGYRYGRPGPLPTSVPATSNIIPLRQVSPLTAETPFEVLAATGELRQARKALLIHISRHLEAQCRRGEPSVLLSSFQNTRHFGTRTRHRYEEIASLNALTLVLAQGLEARESDRYHLRPLASNSPLCREWVVIIINPHYAAAFVARDCGDSGADEKRRYEYLYVHDRPSVVVSARAFLNHARL